MIRELVKDEKILSQKCEPATLADADVAQDLIDTLASLDDASCLAANQIGVTKAIVVYLDNKKRPHVMYNPKLMLGLHPSRVQEGCLTRDEPSSAKRFSRIRVAFDEPVNGVLVHRKKDYNDWYAQMIQHMIDHCEGKLV